VEYRLPRVWERENGRYFLMGTEFLFGMIENFLEGVMMVTVLVSQNSCVRDIILRQHD
jgi:hypothetical protein